MAEPILPRSREILSLNWKTAEQTPYENKWYIPHLTRKRGSRQNFESFIHESAGMPIFFTVQMIDFSYFSSF